MVNVCLSAGFAANAWMDLCTTGRSAVWFHCFQFPIGRWRARLEEAGHDMVSKGTAQHVQSPDIPTTHV